MALTFSGPVPVPAAQTTPLTVLITGASRGIGFELAKQYATAHKDNVVFAAVRNPDSKTATAVAEFAAKHSNLHVVQLDVDDEHSIYSSAKKVSDVVDHLDVLINNAGVFLGPDPLKATTDEFNASFKTNVTGPLLVTRAYLPLLQKSKEGKVIQVSSALGSNKYANLLGSPVTSYGVSKAALNYLNTAFSIAVKDVAFVTISPGWVETDMGSAGGRNPPTKVSDSAQATRYYINRTTIKDSGSFLDIPTGEILAF